MNRKAFTLMELLLVIAILAIIAAAGAPMFQEGSHQALEESKKSSFYNAYQNAISGANIMMAMLLTSYRQSVKGKDPNMPDGFLNENLTLDALNQWKVNGEVRNLNFYSPVLSRCFTDLNGKQYFFSAKFGPDQTIVIYYVDVDDNTYGDQHKDLAYYHGAAYKAKDKKDRVIEISGNKDLDYYWKKINNLL